MLGIAKQESGMRLTYFKSRIFESRRFIHSRDAIAASCQLGMEGVKHGAYSRNRSGVKKAAGAEL